MNPIKKLAVGVYKTVNKVGSAVSGAFKQGNSNLAGLGASTYLGGGKSYASPIQQAAQNTSIKTGPGITYTPIPSTLKSGAGVPKNVTPTGSIMSQSAFNSLQSARGTASNASAAYTPINSYGGLTPTTLSSKRSTAPTANQSFMTSAGETQSIQSFRPSADNSSFSSISSTSMSSPGASISLPSAPGASNPGAINTAGTVSDLNGSKQIDPNTGLLIDTPQDPMKAEEERRASEQKDLLDFLQPKETVGNDSEVQKQEAEVRARKQELNNYTSQLNSIVAKQNQDLLQTRGTLSAEGSTEAVYGGIAAQINREAAIKALPIQAQISAAQGNLELAQDYLTDLKKIKQDAIDADYSYNIKKFESIAGFVTGEQKVRLDALKQTETRAYETTKQNIDDQDAWAREVAKVKPSLISRINALNPASPTFRTDLGNIVSELPATSSTSTTGKYNTVQDKQIDQINTSINNSFDFKAVASAKSAADGVIASLGQKSGLGDIAAINQFQKVIDDGAVTRDQDVKLVQSAQSLADSLKLKIKKLNKGEQLSESQRTEMANTVTKLYEAKLNNLFDSPYVKAQTIKAEQNGIDVTDTILGQLGSFGKKPTPAQTAKDGDMKEYQGVNYKLIQGVWTPQ